ncbi:hypothetical protein [Halorhabdus salina]|uniref:hypothetical protein n=1 Tax=Halorhabdus salina TaxID=2750670 RepID=UPI0015EE43C5|nr:hypothetical protein [Halorhabdus salina]
MVRTTRRQLLAGVTMAALPSCLSSAVAGEPTTASESSPSETATPTPDSDDTSLPDTLKAVLDPVPESVDSTQASRISIATPSPEQESTSVTMWNQRADEFGLDEDSVDRIATAIYGEDRNRIMTLVGSFDANDPNAPEEIPDSAVHRDDGLFILGMASQGGAWTDGVSVAKDAIDDDLEFSEETRLALAQVADSSTVQVFPSFPPSTVSGLPDIDTEVLESVALGVDRIDPTAVQYAIVGVYTDESAYDADDFETLLKDPGSGDGSVGTVKQDGRVAIGSIEIASPSSELRERSPDLWLRVQYDAETGTAKLLHSQDEPVSTDGLALYIDGQEVTDVWNGEEFGPKEAITVEADLLSSIVLEWTDPENPEYQTVVSQELVTDRVRFEEDYARESGTLTLTYTGPKPITATDRIEIEHRSSSTQEYTYREQEADTGSLAAYHDTLSPGDKFEIDGVTLHDRVSLSATHSVERGTTTQSLSSSVYHFRAQVPGHFTLDQQEEPTLVYGGRRARDPANYRVTVAGTELSDGLEDEYDTLESGDEFPIDGEVGDEVVVEWTGAGGPATAFNAYITPPVSFELNHAPDGFELVYRSEQGYEGDPDAFKIEAYGSDSKTKFTEEYETLEDGDSVDIAFDRMSFLRVEWTVPEEPVRIDGISLRQMVEFEMDGTSLRFAGEGEWSAEAFGVTVDGESIDGFSDTITKGDSIDLDVDTGSTVEVVWENGSTEVDIFSETVHPSFEFTVEYDSEEESLTLTSETDAKLDPAEVAVSTYGSQIETNPSVWAEEYDVVEAGDSITLSVSGEPEGLAVEHESWNAYFSKGIE